MQEKLQLHLQEKQYRDMLVQYHFGEHDLEQLRQIGSLIEQAAEPMMYYGLFTRGVEDDEASDDTSSVDRTAVIVTLGSGVDELQNRYTQRERLTESYMTECIGMEFLRAAYEQAAERIHAYTGRWISDFEFVGDKIPFTYMEEAFRLLEPQEVSYNQAYMLTPKKTAVFLTNLCDERKDSYCHICEDCTYLVCPNRVKDSGNAALGKNLTYGYQKIFGDKG